LNERKRIKKPNKMHRILFERLWVKPTRMGRRRMKRAGSPEGFG
jgi:hypothetical protein